MRKFALGLTTALLGATLVATLGAAPKPVVPPETQVESIVDGKWMLEGVVTHVYPEGYIRLGGGMRVYIDRTTAVRPRGSHFTKGQIIAVTERSRFEVDGHPAVQAAEIDIEGDTGDGDLIPDHQPDDTP